MNSFMSYESFLLLNSKFMIRDGPEYLKKHR